MISEWDALGQVERRFLMNAMEMDILPGVFGDLTDAEQDLPLNVLTTIIALDGRPRLD